MNDLPKPLESIGKKGRDAIESFFPGTLKAVNAGKCPCCLKPVGELRNRISIKEYGISGMCQKCQDATFGED